MQLTTVSYETTEFNGQEIITTTTEIKKKRRGRKERRDNPRSNTGTTSSSGVNATVSNPAGVISSAGYEYNHNQLTAQYGNSNAGIREVEDLELGMGASATNNYSINNI